MYIYQYNNGHNILEGKCIKGNFVQNCRSKAGLKQKQTATVGFKQAQKKVSPKHDLIMATIMPDHPHVPSTVNSKGSFMLYKERKEKDRVAHLHSKCFIMKKHLYSTLKQRYNNKAVT